MSNIIAQPYAEALVNLAKKEEGITKITNDLLNISTLLSNSKSLKQFMDNPVISKKSKKTVLEELLAKQVNNVVLNFLYLLVDKNRMSLFNKILTNYIQLANNLDCTTVVYLKTAKNLTSEQYQQLKNKIQQMTDAKIVKINTEINRDLIGGFVLQIGSKVIDTSLLGQLKKMASHLNTVNMLT